MVDLKILSIVFLLTFASAVSAQTPQACAIEATLAKAIGENN